MYKELYLEHYLADMQVRIAVENLKAILNEEELIFQVTQPKSPVTDSDKVDGGIRENKADKYVEVMEEREIEARRQKAQDVLAERLKVADLYVERLKESIEQEDQVYYLFYIKGYHPDKISDMIQYSIPHTYRILNRVRTRIKMLGRDFIVTDGKDDNK